MKRTPLSRTVDAKREDHPDLERFVTLLQQGQYLRRMPEDALREVLRSGDLLALSAGEVLIRQGEDHNREMYVLLQGSLAVSAGEKFILRLQDPGDVAGEMAALTGAPRSADVRAESDSLLAAFPSELLSVPANASQAPLLYYMLSHILATKLHMTTLQSLLRKDERVSAETELDVALMVADSFQRQELHRCLEDILPGCRIQAFENQPALLDRLPRIDLLVADIWDGCEAQRDMETARKRVAVLRKLDAPILVVSEFCSDPARASALLEWGVEEALPSTWCGPDLRRALLRLESWRSTRRELDRVERAADTDALTGLANRRRLAEFLQVLEDSSRHGARPFALIIADVDHFKLYNDRNGHQAGDEVLRAVAATIRRSVRAGDLTARYGGEEFVVVLPDTTVEAAVNVAEKLRRAVADEAMAHGQSQPAGRVTITVGVAGYPDHADDAASLLSRADECLYVGKEAGRNCVISASSSGSTT